MIYTACSFRKDPTVAIQWVNEVLKGSTTGCVEVRRSHNFIHKALLYVATLIQRYYTGRCLNCDAKKISHRYFLICPYCELVPPRKR